MPRRSRRNHTPISNSKVALAALRDDKTVAKLAQKLDVHRDQISQSKRQLRSPQALCLKAVGDWLVTVCIAVT